MNYLRVFFGFWRRFIVGDDSRIAVTVMWLLILVKSLTLNSMNSWLLLPIAVLVLLYALVYEKITSQTYVQRLSTLNIMLVSAVIPMVVVTALPLLLFRVTSGATDLRYTWLPTGFYIVISLALLAALYRLFKAMPILTIFLFGVVAVLILTVWQDSIGIQLQNIVDANHAVVSAVAVVITLGFIAGCMYVLAGIKRAKD